MPQYLRYTAISTTDMSLEELKQDPFNVDEFVERLAWRSTEKDKKLEIQSELVSVPQQQDAEQQRFDPMILHGVFCQTIQQITEYRRKLDKKAQMLEAQCIDEEGRQRKKVNDLLKENQVCFAMVVRLEGAEGF